MPVIEDGELLEFLPHMARATLASSPPASPRTRRRGASTVTPRRDRKTCAGRRSVDENRSSGRGGTPGQRRVPPPRVMAERRAAGAPVRTPISVSRRNQSAAATAAPSPNPSRSVARIPSADVSLRQRVQHIGTEDEQSRQVLRELHVPELPPETRVEPLLWEPVQLPLRRPTGSARLFLQRVGLAEASGERPRELAPVRARQFHPEGASGSAAPSPSRRRTGPRSPPRQSPSAAPLAPPPAQLLPMGSAPQAPPTAATGAPLPAVASKARPFDHQQLTLDPLVLSAGEPESVSRALNRFRTLNAQQYELQQQQLHVYDGNRVASEMRASVHRVERMLLALNKGNTYRDAIYYEKMSERAASSNGIGSAGTGATGLGSTFTDESSAVDELKEIIQVLLREISRLTDQGRKLELQEQLKDQLLRDARDELGRAVAKNHSLSAQLDQLIREKEAAQHTAAKLEAELRNALDPRRTAMAAVGSIPTRGKGVSQGGNSSTIPDYGRLLRRPSVSRRGTWQCEGKGDTEARENDRDDSEEDDSGSASGEALCLLPRAVEEAPQGDVTVVCTAIQGQAKLWELFPEEMQTAVTTHNRVMREIVLQHRGYHVKTFGDEWVVVFQDTLDAVAFALQLQRELVDQCWPPVFDDHPDTTSMEFDAHSPTAGEPHEPHVHARCSQLWSGLRVRVGIHSGDVIAHEDPRTGGRDYMGPTVNRAMLMRRIAFGGMAAVSKPVYRRVQGELTRAEAEDAAIELLGDEEAIERAHAECGAECRTGQEARQRIAERARRARPDIRCSATFHVALSAQEEVYCLLPLELEDRLDTIQLAVKALAAASGLASSARLAVSAATDEDNAASELENLLGAGSAAGGGDGRSGAGGQIVTADGVLELHELVSVPDGRSEIEASGLPSGDLALLVVRAEHCDRAGFMQRLKVRDAKAAVAHFQTLVVAALSPYGGRLVTQEGDRHIIVFSTTEAAVQCAGHIDADVLDTDWTAVVSNAEAHDELRTQHWRGVKIFSGLRPCFGVQAGRLQPHYDPLSRQVGYVGRDPFIAARLCALARGGQIVMHERVCADVLPRLRPLPLIMQVSMAASAPSSSGGASPEQPEPPEALVACVLVPRHLVGRLFAFHGMDFHATWRRHPRYLHLREQIEREALRWSKRAALLVPRSTVLQQEQQGPFAADALGGSGGAVEATTTAAARSEALLDSAGLDNRRRDHACASSLAQHLALRCLTNGASDPLVAQLEAVEHNLMVLEDWYHAATGGAVEYLPIVLDIADMRGLLQARPGAAAASGGADAEGDLERLLALQHRQQQLLDDDGGSDGGSDDGGLREGRGVAGAPSAKLTAAQREERRRQRVAEKETSRAFASLEEELAHLRDERGQLASDVLALHKMIRFFFSLVRTWMEPVLDLSRGHSLTDDEVLQRMLTHFRALQQDVAHRTQPPPARSSADEWRRVTQLAVERDAEEALRDDGAKLCRSAVGHLCRHFVQLRSFVKRLKVREAARGGGGGGARARPASGAGAATGSESSAAS